MSRRAFWGWLVVIALMGALLRVGVGWELQDTRQVREPVVGSDMRTYIDFARAILAGHGPRSYYFQPFYYAVFLPVLFAVAGSGPMAIISAHALVSALAVLLAGWTAARVFGRFAGLVAAVLLALAEFHIFKSQFALSDVLGSLWAVSVIAVAMCAYDRPRWPWWAMLGILLGAGTATRGNIITLMPGALALLAWRHRREPRRLAGAALTILTLLVVVELPFSLTNWRATGRWTGPSTAGEAVLAAGNNPESPPGTYANLPTFRSWSRGAGPTDSAYPAPSQLLREWIRREPFAWVELKLRAALLFFGALDVPNNVDIRSDGLPFSRLLRLPLLVPSGLIVGLGFAGMLLSLRGTDTRAPETLFLLYAAMALSFSTVALFVLGRYRLVVVPLLCVFSGHAVSTAADGLRATTHPRSRDNIAGSAALIVSLLSLVLVPRAFDLYQEHLEQRVMRWVRPRGVLATDRDDRIVYDHGPRPLGGWTDLALPAGVSTTIQKRFWPADVPELRDMVASELRVPLRFRRTGRATVEIRRNGTTIGSVVAQGTAHDDILWAEVAITNIPPAADSAEFALSIEIRPDADAQVSLVVDALRDYGRTQVRAGAATIALPSGGAEACIELRLAPQTTGRTPAQ